MAMSRGMLDPEAGGEECVLLGASEASTALGSGFLTSDLGTMRQKPLWA